MKISSMYENRSFAIAEWVLKSRGNFTFALLFCAAYAFAVWSGPTYLFMKYAGYSLGESLLATAGTHLAVTLIYYVVCFVIICWRYDPLANKTRQ